MGRESTARGRSGREEERVGSWILSSRYNYTGSPQKGGGERRGAGGGGGLKMFNPSNIAAVRGVGVPMRND